MPFHIRQMDLLYRGWSSLYMATLADENGVEIRREIEHHGAAAAVLPYDPDRRMVLLVLQARPPVIWCGGPPEFLEAPAGMIDEGDPADAARREAMEETGVRLTELEFVSSTYPMPGVSTERVDLYLAPYAQADRIGPGGGVAHEQEAITVLETPLADFWRRIEAGEIQDMKTLALGLALKVRHPELF
jgi:nudix-type nucleoside diphosphatase (YffH/AdpP family)